MTLKAQLEGLNARQQEIAAEIEAFGEVDKNDDKAYAIAIEQVGVLNLEFDENEKQTDVLGAAYSRTIKARNNLITQAIPPGTTPGGDGPGIGEPGGPANVGEALEAWDRIRIPRKAQFCRTKVFDSDKIAYFSGLCIMSMTGNRWATNKLAEVDFVVGPVSAPQNAMDGDTGGAGGFSVPHPMAAEIIRLVEEYGVFRRYSRVMPMTSATLDVPKRASGLTVFYPATQGAAITASDIVFEQVNLVAKKAAQLSVWSTELDEDSIISMTDLVTTEMAWAFAQAEDLNSFLGDGTSGSNNITGISDALLAGAKVVSAGSAGAMLWSDVTLANYHEMIGKLQWYPGISPVWFINHQGFSESMQAILYALGGNTVATGAGGTPMEFLGYPVVRTQVLTRNPLTAGQMIAVFGDLRLTTMLGNRRDVTMIMLRELFAVNDQIGIQSTMRTDTQIHDVGTSTEAGGLVGLFSP